MQHTSLLIHDFLVKAETIVLSQSPYLTPANFFTPQTEIDLKRVTISDDRRNQEKFCDKYTSDPKKSQPKFVYRIGSSVGNDMSMQREKLRNRQDQLVAVGPKKVPEHVS